MPKSTLIPFNRTANATARVDDIGPVGFDDFVEDEGFDLRHYWRVVLHYKWGILGLVFGVSLLTLVWAYSLQPVYRATATLMVGGGSETIAVSEAGEGQSRFDRSRFLGTQYELLRSREVARAVLEQLGPARSAIEQRRDQAKDAGFDWRAWVPPSWLERFNLAQPDAPVDEPIAGPVDEPAAAADPDAALLGWLRNNLAVQPVRDTAMVQVSFEAIDPKLAARIANAYTRAYLDYNLTQRQKSTTEASAWLKEQLEKARQHVLTSVEELQQHREAAGLVNVEGMHSVQTEQLREAATALSQAQRARAEAESLFLRAQRLQREGRMDAIPAVRENGWIRSLRDKAEELERQVRSNERKYTAGYARLTDERSELKAVRSQITAALEKIIQGFRTDYEIARANEAQLEKEVAALEASVRALGRKQLEAQALEQSVATNQQSYDAFLSQLMETSTRQQDTVSMIAQVVDPAVPVHTPVKPNKRRMVLMGVLLSLMAGIGIALLLDKLDSTLKRREDIEERLGVPVLGELMLLKARREDGEPTRVGMEFVDEPTSRFAEEIRTIRTGVALSGIDQSRQTLVVTSTVSAEGKSTVALNLAMALGQLGTVLLIDADMRRPSLAKTLGYDSRTTGLSDLVAGTAKVADCVHTLEPGGIHVLFAGSTLPPDPLKILASERFAKLLDHAGETYHAVVIDSAPVELVSDARVLATKVTGVVYVVRADQTSYQAVRQGLGKLAETGAPLLGTVLNQIDPKLAQAYGKYKYGRDHYGRYGHYSYGHAPQDADVAVAEDTRRAG